jgi:hypothetical protein
MENENNNAGVPPSGDEQKPAYPEPAGNPNADKKKRPSDGWVFGINFLIFIGYTAICALIPSGFFLDGFILVFHLLTCIILAGVYNRWAWGVAGLAVFLVGVSTCAGGYAIFAR